MKTIYLDGNSLSIEDVVEVARNDGIVKLKDEAISKIKQSRTVVDEIVSNEKVIYGITTGFGKFSNVVISKKEVEDLQTNLIRSHACGVGKHFSEETVRAIMLLRVNALAKGFSGIRLETINTLIEMINKGVHPLIPEKGSLGASGDLAPLAHMVLVMIGEGEAIYKGKRMSGKEAMDAAGIKSTKLAAKEGLALINGTPVMTAVGALTIYDALNLAKAADIASTLTLEALNGIVDAFDERVQAARPQKGQIICAKNLLRLVKNSKNVTRQGEVRVQDSYTLRCIPQVHGASKDAVNYVKDVVNIEINSATDNPLIFTDNGDVISGGNFHGQPIALAFDFLGIALSEYANISERRIAKLIDPALNDGLPAFLIENGGINSGFMILQYSAASLVSENKVLAHPASVDSIPSSANQEDHVSMGTIACRKAREILNNTRKVLSMEILASCQAIDLRGNKGLGKGTNKAYEIVRGTIDKIENDKIMYKEINKSEELVKSNIILTEVEKVIGKLD